jgi:hypothetical protein
MMVSSTAAMPRFAHAVWATLNCEAQYGEEIANWLGLHEEVVYEALVWMEARGYAALRPSGLNRYGWVPGFNEMTMKEAA